MRTLIFLIIGILLCCFSGCTIELKAKDFEGKGSISGIYEFDRLTWSKAPENPMFPEELVFLR